MKPLLLTLLFMISAPTYAQDQIWPDGLPCGRHIGLSSKNTLTISFTQYNWYSRTFKEVIDYMSQLMHRPDLKLSFDYIQMRAGFKVMTNVDYAVDCQSFPEVDDEIKALQKTAETRRLTPDDFKGPRWINIVQPIDTEEANCLTLSRINGVIGGCGDIWQDGISEDEAVCFKNKTYLKCHVECLEKIYDRQIDFQPGRCP